MEKLFSKLSGHEGLVLAAIPFIGTYLAFIFEAGYLSFYDIPTSFIKVDFTRIISAIAIITSFSSFFYIAFIVLRIIAKGDHPIRKAVIEPLFYTLFFGIILYFIPLSSDKWWWLLALSIILFILKFIPPFFHKKYYSSYIETLSKLEEKSKPKEGSDNFTLKDIFGVLVLCTFIVFLYGRFHASEKTQYWSLTDHPNMIIVEIYGEIVLIKDYDSITKQLGNNLEAINISENPDLKLIKNKLGKLKAAKLK